MSISDVITLVSLVIAIIAILNEKNRSHILLRLHILDYVFFIGSFILINYFIFYESFYSRGYYIQELYFQNFGLKNPKNWAYIITLLVLCQFFFKVLYAFYPFFKVEKVIAHYQKQIENNEISFLLDLIEKYHRRDIIRLIDKTQDYTPASNPWDFQHRRKKVREKIKDLYVQSIRYLFPSSWFNRHAYAHAILYNVISHPGFIVLASNQRPYLFASICSQFKAIKRNAFPDDLINRFLNELLKEKNFWLIKELKESEKNDPVQPEWFFEENKILASLLQDLSVADINQVWQSFGHAAIRELEEERTKGFESKLFHEFREDDLLWEYTTYSVIQFYFILINEAINKQYRDSHFWLYYYDRIIETILKTYEKYPPSDIENQTTVYHKIIEIIINRCFYWLELSNQREHPGMYYDVLKCIGNIINAICKSPYFGERRKINTLDLLFREYCNIENNEYSEKLLTKFEEIFIRPNMLTDENHPYYKYIATAWDSFDKIPHRSMQGHGVDLPYFTRLKTNVIIPLGLNPDKY